MSRGRTGDIIGMRTIAVFQAVSERADPSTGWTPLSRLLDLDQNDLLAVSVKFIELHKASVRLTHDARVLLEFSKSLGEKK